MTILYFYVPNVQQSDHLSIYIHSKIIFRAVFICDVLT